VTRDAATDALRALPQTRIVHDVQCTDDWRVRNTPFEGVRLADLLDAAGVRPEGKARHSERGPEERPAAGIVTNDLGN
jgi:DMSO/TMAO reductase YedYZ molybdopterin-dependent catalytic subunit